MTSPDIRSGLKSRDLPAGLILSPVLLPTLDDTAQRHLFPSPLSPGQKPKGVQEEQHLRPFCLPSCAMDQVAMGKVALQWPLAQGERRTGTKSHRTLVRFTGTLALRNFLAGICLTAQSQHILGPHKQ